MLYLYEEYIDVDDNGEVSTIISEGECKQTNYTHTPNFINLGEWAGQSGSGVVDGMVARWFLIYVGY